MKKKIIFLVLGAVVLLAASMFYYQSLDTSQIIYRTAKVERGNIIKSVSASGELNSVVTVQVGSEISGQISELFVDYNTHVKAGQVIARMGSTSSDSVKLHFEIRRNGLPVDPMSLLPKS